MTLYSPITEHLQAAKPVKRFKQIFPLYPSEASSLDEDVKMVAKAMKKETMLRRKFALKCTSAAKNKDAAYLYLSSRQSLIVGMLEANKRRPYHQRLSLRQIIDAAQAYKVLIKLDEPVNLYRKPKSSGSGFRTICDFGPVARGAQRMVLTLLREAYTPAPFQFTRQGVQPAIKEALRLITEEGYAHVAELDIKSQFPSFEADKLLKTLPLPKGAIKEIILAQSAIWKPHGVLSYEIDSLLHQTQLGIPQGSAASAVVAEWSVSHLDFKAKNVALINYADNFFLFAKDAATLTHVLEVLRLAIAGLPGGSFIAHPPAGDPTSMGTVQVGFRMLGCWIGKSGDTVLVEPTETSQQELSDRFHSEAGNVIALLAKSEKAIGPAQRIEGVQAYLRLRSYVRSWLAAHACCTDIPDYLEDQAYQLNELENAFNITTIEMKAYWDRSVETQYHPKSGWKNT